MPAMEQLERAGSIEEKVLDGVEDDGKTFLEDEAWVPADFVHEPPVMKVIQPKGSFCQIDARFSVALDPEGVYNIITDPNNRRVFKNIKEVTFRKVLEDDGNRQLVEVEQLGRWRFLMISGTFSSRVIVEQNRQEHLMIFDLSKQGMMRSFSGSWKIEPMLASEQDAERKDGASQVDGQNTGNDSVVGSWVIFHQILEPAIIPPWPLNRYVKGVTERIIREMLRFAARMLAPGTIEKVKPQRCPEVGRPRDLLLGGPRDVSFLILRYISAFCRPLKTYAGYNTDSTLSVRFLQTIVQDVYKDT